MKTKYFEEYIIKSGLLKSNIFALPEDKQNEYLKNILHEHKLIEPVITYKFPDAGNIMVSLYMPVKTGTLLRKYKYSKETIRALDMIYAILVRRKYIITIKVGTEEQKNYLWENSIMPDALLAMFFDSYNILPDHIRNNIVPYNPCHFVQEVQN